jgi:sporulation protein YlmC with PRC-barrel domain
MVNVAYVTNLSGNVFGVAKMRGSLVFNTRLEQVASVKDLLIDNATGRLVQVVLKYGGHLGVGNHFCSLPWQNFTYNAELAGFIVDCDFDTLKSF